MKRTPLLFGLCTIALVAQSAPRDGKPIASHKVIVQEVIQTTNYTYLHGKENDSLKWLAVPKMEAKAGETYYYAEGLPMAQFESKELHRTFDMVMFLGGVSTEPIGSAPKQHQLSAGSEPYKRKAAQEVKKDLKIVTPADCITIRDLFAKKEAYAGKTVRIKGQVTKFSPEIMDKNWIHLQDGTENNGKFDLVITSKGTVKVGDIVTLEGKIALNKDFGYGYVFDAMMEEATLK
jgi:hypothetical protein